MSYFKAASSPIHIPLSITWTCSLLVFKERLSMASSKSICSAKCLPLLFNFLIRASFCAGQKSPFMIEADTREFNSILANSILFFKSVAISHVAESNFESKAFISVDISFMIFDKVGLDKRMCAATILLPI